MFPKVFCTQTLHIKIIAVKGNDNEFTLSSPRLTAPKRQPYTASIEIGSIYPRIERN
jgi:hypothetical protein